jgi:hypothetical protein
MRQDLERRRSRWVTLGKQGWVAADGVANRSGVEGLLDIAAVEVVVGPITLGGEAKFVVEERAEVCQNVSKRGLRNSRRSRNLPVKW